MSNPKEAGAEDAARHVRKRGRQVTMVLWALGLGLYTLWASVYWFAFGATQAAVTCFGPIGTECPEPMSGPSFNLVSDTFVVTVAGLAVLSLLIKLLFSSLASSAYKKAKSCPAPQAF